MPTKKLCVLGSTGSIGTQCLSLVQALGIEVTTISGNRNSRLLEQQALQFKPKYVCAVDETAAKNLKLLLAHTDAKVLSGSSGLLEAVGSDGSDTVLTAVVGFAGLAPTVAAINARKTVALANKETLVTAGHIITGLAAQNNVKLLPVDSEHSAIFQCLQDAYSARKLTKIFLTASGGPFFGKTAEELKSVTVEQALNHPNWKMGKKITVDSATLMNKGLELIEAMWLFGLEPDDIEITVHRQSIVHSMVEFSDGSVLAQLAVPDMRIPIQYALTYPDRLVSPVERLSIERMSELTFERADDETFACLRACKAAAKRRGLAPCAVNAANETAVAAFLEGKIGFNTIGKAVEHALSLVPQTQSFSIADVCDTDREIREQTRFYLFG